MPDARELEEVAERYIEAGWRRGDTRALDRLLAPDFINRGSNGGGAAREAFLRGVAELFAGMPDFRASVEDVVIDAAAGKAAIRWTGVGTHTGAIMGMQPTGRRLSFGGIDIVRVEGGLVAERWGESNAAEAFARV